MEWFTVIGETRFKLPFQFLHLSVRLFKADAYKAGKKYILCEYSYIYSMDKLYCKIGPKHLLTFLKCFRHCITCRSFFGQIIKAWLKSYNTERCEQFMILRHSLPDNRFSRHFRPNPLFIFHMWLHFFLFHTHTYNCDCYRHAVCRPLHEPHAPTVSLPISTLISRLLPTVLLVATPLNV